MVYCSIQCLGGGGGGGGAAATTGAQYSCGGGGGSGEYASGIFSASTIGASKSVTIGAAGAANSGATGGNGGTTSVGSTLISASRGYRRYHWRPLSWIRSSSSGRRGRRHRRRL